MALKCDIWLKPADYDAIHTRFKAVIDALKEIEESLGSELENSPRMRKQLTAVIGASDRAHCQFKSKAKRVDWPEEWRDGCPVLPAHFDRWNRDNPGEIIIAVDCPFCGREHEHGAFVEDGVTGATSWHLRSHCTRGPLLHGSYHIQLDDACRQKMARLRLRTQ